MNVTKGKIVQKAALLIDIGGPFAATLSQFPVWVERSSEATVSGLFLIFAFLSCIPFLKQLKEYFKSPSAIVVWGIIFAVFMVIRNIADEICFVSLVGLASNALGAGLYKLGSKLNKGSDT